MTVQSDAEELAREAGMQFDSRYMHWVSARGKFENEQWYAPYYYDHVLNGAADEIYPADMAEGDDCAPGSLLAIDAEEAEAFNLECGHWILVREDPQGFVYVTVHPTRDEAEAKYRNWIGE
jgi:hypothetical protein